MELVYIWIHNFRNIKKSGVTLNNRFDVQVTEEGFIEKEHVGILSRLDQQTRMAKTAELFTTEKIGFSKIPRSNDLTAIIPKIKMNVTKNDKKNNCINYGNNIKSISALVGKNSVGKSNLLDCIGDVSISIDSSNFVLVYYDEVCDDFILECNQISVEVFGKQINAVKGSYQPGTKTVRITESGKIKPLTNSELEYISIAERLDDMIYPNANAFSSDIPRFGLKYDRSNIYYAYQYLINDRNIENYKNNKVALLFEIERVYKTSEFQILPDCFPGEKYMFDLGDEGHEFYKKTFMFRFFERIVNNFHFTDAEEIQEDLKEVNELVESYNSINELVDGYSVIKSKIINMRNDLNGTSKENNIDMKKTYYEFIEDLELLVDCLSSDSFQNSHKLLIEISSENINEIQNVLEHFEHSDVDMEFGKSLSLKLNNVSDGLNYYLKLFSTIKTCMYRNETEKYRNVILLLDEPEARFHPELARCFIAELSDFLYKYFKELKFQILITTHSPFILSDILNDNIIKISKNDNGIAEFSDVSINTFGADVHYLLKDAFFLPVTTGEFSRRKIRGIIEVIKPNKDGILPTLSKTDIDKHHQVISSIGEPIIKNKLLIMLKNCMGTDERINFLSNEMAKLKDEIDALRYK